MSIPTSDSALLPDAPLFDVTRLADAGVDAALKRFALDQIELAPNARKHLTGDLDGLAVSLCLSGQLVPLIGYQPERPEDSRPHAVIYDGQRRYLAARRSHELVGTAGNEHLRPVESLIVLLLGHEPSAEDIRKLQSIVNNAREALTLADQQAQFACCWEARAGFGDDERLAAVCADLGINAKKAHNLRRQLTLPAEIRERVAERPAGSQLSVTLANKLADMNEIAPALTTAVAQQVTSSELHEQASRNIGAFVHKSIVESAAYAVRIDDGTLLDAHAELKRARPQLTEQSLKQAATVLHCDPANVHKELDKLEVRAKSAALKAQITPEIRQRAANGRYAYVHDPGRDFAASVWVVDPVFIIDLVHEHAKDADQAAPARTESYFAAAKLVDDELHQAAEDERKRVAAERARQRDAEHSNLGLGQDIAAGLIDLTRSQRDALRAIVCHTLAAEYREVLAYGAGWSDRERQQPVGDTGRYEPRHIDAIVQAELQRSLDDTDPLRGIAQLVTRIGAAFMLNEDGITRTKALGRERIGRKLSDALPGGASPRRTAWWELMRPLLSPALAQLNRDAFVIDETESTVDLEKHRGDSRLDELDLGEAT